MRLVDLRSCGVGMGSAASLQRATEVVGAPASWFGDGSQGTIEVLWAMEEAGALNPHATPAGASPREQGRGRRIEFDFSACSGQGAIEALREHAPSLAAGGMMQGALLALGKLAVPLGWRGGASRSQAMLATDPKQASSGLVYGSQSVGQPADALHASASYGYASEAAVEATGDADKGYQRDSTTR